MCHYKMKCDDGSEVLLKDVKVEYGVLFGTIIAEMDGQYYAFIKRDARRIIVSGSFMLEESNAPVYDTSEEYLNAELSDFVL